MFILIALVYIYIYIYIPFFKFHDCCYVLGLSLFQIFSYILTLLGFHLSMLNKYHFSFGYFEWFILFTCMNILVFNFIVFLFLIYFYFGF